MALSWALVVGTIGAPELGIGVQSRLDLPPVTLGSSFDPSTAPLTTSASCPHPVADSGTQRDQASDLGVPSKNSQPGQGTLVVGAGAWLSHGMCEQRIAGPWVRESPPIPAP